MLGGAPGGGDIMGGTAACGMPDHDDDGLLDIGRTPSPCGRPAGTGGNGGGGPGTPGGRTCGAGMVGGGPAGRAS